jgi:hypothetical protein
MMHNLALSNYRFSGTIVGVEDNKSSGWADSEWRSLKVNLFLLSYTSSFQPPYWGRKSTKLTRSTRIEEEEIRNKRRYLQT